MLLPVTQQTRTSAVEGTTSAPRAAVTMKARTPVPVILATCWPVTGTPAQVGDGQVGDGLVVVW